MVSRPRNFVQSDLKIDQSKGDHLTRSNFHALKSMNYCVINYCALYYTVVRKIFFHSLYFNTQSQTVETVYFFKIFRSVGILDFRSPRFWTSDCSVL